VFLEDVRRRAGKKRVPSVLGRPRAPLANAVQAVFEGEEEEEEEMKEEDVSSERRRELLPLSIHRKRKTTELSDFCVVRSEEKCEKFFLFISAKRLNFFFSKTTTTIILFTRERTSSLRRRVQRTTTTTTCDDHERIHIRKER
jgi:hypothetical protein